MALAASAGLALDPWQADVLEVALGEREDGKWAAREFGLVVPRQNGKGAILEALLVAALLLFDERLILYSAHEFKTAQETFLRVKALVESCDDLAGRVTKIHNAHGAEGIEFVGGKRLRFVARTKGSGRGFTPERIILDEALNLSRRAVSALLFSMSAQANPQLWYTSSHPDDTADSDVLRKVMRRGRAGDGNLAYVEYAAADGTGLDEEEFLRLLDDPGARERANPGHPIRITAETMESERAATDPVDYGRERMGIVDLDEGKADRGWHVITSDEWAGCLDPAAVAPLEGLAWAVDCSPDGASASIACSDGKYGEVVDHRPGTSWVPPRLRELHTTYGTTVRLDDKGPAGALVSELDDLGVPWEKVTFGQHAQACGELLAAVKDRTFTHRGQPPLDAAVKVAERRQVTDVWLWTRSKSSGDVSPLVAVTIARWAAGQDREADFYML